MADDLGMDTYQSVASYQSMASTDVMAIRVGRCATDITGRAHVLRRCL